MNHFNIDKQPKIKTGFNVPDHYFENFSESVMLRINENNTKVISIKRYNQWWSVAAAILIVSLGIFSVYKIYNKPYDIDQSILENYITTDANISNEELIDLLNETNIQNMDISSNISESDIEDFLTQNSNLEQYLIN